ncbi:hypothetical protein BV22DRAFT_1052650 [Leucogyrophana mollusca]|uniref:Uncharacterized protein n=1 Tax=Leucogyrophana mollusca TaxID=85980 RepID=A0ACB8AUH8_9AGAM|nr:hypothetical protein BV22DRAFT_1052650 [Leucogyrophana mollusca]
MSALIPLQNTHSTFIRAFRYKDDPKSPWVAATTSRPLPIKFGDHLIVRAISSRPRSWFFSVVTGVACLEKDWAILELTASKTDYGRYVPLSILMWTCARTNTKPTPQTLTENTTEISQAAWLFVVGWLHWTITKDSNGERLEERCFINKDKAGTWTLQKIDMDVVNRRYKLD